MQPWTMVCDARMSAKMSHLSLTNMLNTLNAQAVKQALFATSKRDSLAIFPDGEVASGTSEKNCEAKPRDATREDTLVAKFWKVTKSHTIFTQERRP
jgi:hypothetical protein